MYQASACWRYRVGAFLCVLLAAFLVSACSGEPEEEVAEAPVEVPVRSVHQEAVTIAHTYTGRTSGAREVAIRARVEGLLHSREYAEGALVEAGSALFRIDSGPYEVRVQSAMANLERAEAERRQAEREWERVLELYEDDAASGRERDAAQSELELAEAEVTMAEAQLAEARIDLDFTTVETPLRGVAGREEEPIGSLLEIGDLLTTVTQLDPIHVEFSVPENHMREYGTQIRAGTGVGVQMEHRDGGMYRHVGRIDFTEAAIDEATGTVGGRAVFPNREGELMPGQFVRVTLTGLYAGSGFRVPEAAVIANGDDRSVLVVNADDEIEQRTIEVIRELGGAYLVTGDLDNGDRILVEGTTDLRPGDRVTPREEPEEPTGIFVPLVPPGLDELRVTPADEIETPMQPLSYPGTLDDHLNAIDPGVGGGVQALLWFDPGWPQVVFPPVLEPVNVDADDAADTDETDVSPDS